MTHTHLDEMEISEIFSFFFFFFKMMMKRLKNVPSKG